MLRKTKIAAFLLGAMFACAGAFGQTIANPPGTGGAGSGTVTSLSSGTGITVSPNPTTTTGSVSINAAIVPTYTGTTTATHCANWNSAGVLADAGAACGSGGAGTVTSLTGGTGITLSPSTITSTGSITVNAAVIPSYTGTTTAGDCVKWSSAGVLADQGAACGTGGSVSLTAGTGLTASPSTITGTGSFAVNTSTTPQYTGALVSGHCADWSGTGGTLADAGAACGTVTSVIAGSGLSGGTITGSGTVSLNLANANTWTATQTFGVIGGYTANVQAKSAAYTLVASDCGTELNVSVSSTVAITLPSTMPIGCQVAVVQGGTAKVTLLAGSGATLNSPHSYTGTFAQFSTIGAQVISNAGSAAVWTFVGDGS